MKIETLAVHAGRRIDPATGAVAAPIHMSSTFERDAEGGYPRGFSYSREDNPNRRALEECLAALEGGAEALMFSSGLAVLTAVVQGMEPGDHLLVADDVYYALRRVLGEVFGKWPLEASFVDMTDLDAVRAAMRPATRLVWVETPSNPLLKVIDLAAIAGVARAGNAISICDSTFAPPVIQRPLEFGIDMVMHSTTKYIGGHSDTVGGVLVRSHDNYLFERCRKSLKFGGAVPSPFECWLTLRSVETLPWRVRAQSENALRLAQYLEGHPGVQRVHYPGLELHPQHQLAARQMQSGFGGMLSFEVKGGEREAMAVAARVKVFTRATSLGSTHSLIEHRASIEGPHSKTPKGLLRVSVGLEHADDLIGDLGSALRA
jgi:cystathionine gamma-synthase